MRAFHILTTAVWVCCMRYGYGDLEQQNDEILNEFWESVKGVTDFPAHRLYDNLQLRLDKTNPFTAKFFAHRDRVHNYTKFIRNDFAKQLIRSFMIFCPDIPMCYDQGEFYQNYTFFVRGDGELTLPNGYRMVGLCRACSCTADCENWENCCISKYIPDLMLQNESEIGEFTFRSTKQLVRFSCLTTQLGEVVDKTGVAIALPKQKYFMVAHCPDDYPKDAVWRKCRRFLPPEQRRQEDLFTSVFSIKTNISYQNEYCAECFGEANDDLFLWIKVIVSNKRNENERVVTDPFLMAYNKEIVIFFRPPLVLDANSICYEPDISKCNESGIWRTHDARLLLACETLPQTVVYGVNNYGLGSYKNIYCAMCNVENPEYVLDFTRFLYSSAIDSAFQELDMMFYRQTLGLFVSLLSFSALDVLSEYNVDEKCRPEEIYSPILKRCLPIVCDSRYNQKGPKCQRIISMDISAFFITSLTICNTKPFVNNLNKDIGKELSDRAFLIKNRFKELTFRVSLPFITRWNIICVYAFLTSVPIRSENVVVLSNYLIAFFNNFTVFYQNNSLVRIRKNDMNRDNFNMHHPNIFIFKLIDYETKTISLPSIAARWEHCPKVYLSENYQINYTDSEICILEYNICFESQHAEINEHYEVAICLDLYEDITNNYTRMSSDEGSPETYFSVVCLSTSSLGCLLTVVVSLATHDKMNMPTKINIALSFSLFLANTFYTASRFFIYYFPLCMLFGILSHYLWLTVLCWMCVSCLDLFITMANALKISSQSKQNGKFFAYVIVCLTLSMVIVAVHIQISYQVTGGSSLGYSKTTCFIADGVLKIFTLVLPLTLVVVLNLILFVALYCCIKKNMAFSNSRNNQMFKIYIKLSTVTGVTWVFGLLHELVSIQFFSHIHSLLNGCIGMYIFLAFADRNVSKKK